MARKRRRRGARVRPQSPGRGNPTATWTRRTTRCSGSPGTNKQSRVPNSRQNNRTRHVTSRRAHEKTREKTLGRVVYIISSVPLPRARPAEPRGGGGCLTVPALQESEHRSTRTTTSGRDHGAGVRGRRVGKNPVLATTRATASQHGFRPSTSASGRDHGAGVRGRRVGKIPVLASTRATAPQHGS